MSLLVGLIVLAIGGAIQAALMLWADKQEDDNKPHWATPSAGDLDDPPEGFVWVLMRKEDAKSKNEI